MTTKTTIRLTDGTTVTTDGTVDIGHLETDDGPRILIVKDERTRSTGTIPWDKVMYIYKREVDDE